MMSYTSIDTMNDRWQTIFVSVYETIFVRNYNCQKWCLSETIFVKNDICVYVRISYMSEYRLINTNHICQKRYWSETIIVRNHNCQKRYLSGTIFVRNDICQCLFTDVCDADVVYGKDICDGETVDGDSLQHTATHYNTLQRTATHYNTPQHTATHCNTLQHTATYCKSTAVVCTNTGLWWRDCGRRHTAPHCNTRQHETYYIVQMFVTERL